MSEPIEELGPEDVKILTLARSSRARVRTASGAAVRDLDGRTYTAADVRLPSVSLSALEAAVVMAASSGATGLEAAAVVTTDDPANIDTASVADLGGPGVPVYVASADGTPVATLTT